MKFLLTEGQSSDISSAEALLLSVGLSKKTVLADKGYDSDSLVATILKNGGEVVIPWRSSRKKAPANRKCDWHLYKERHLVECLFNKIKQFRRVATRYEKLADSYLAMLHIAGTLLWLR